MTAQCCAGGGASRRPARQLCETTASMLPGAALVLLPKCPLCLAAWLAAASGLGVSAVSAAQVRWAIAGFWVAALVVLVVAHRTAVLRAIIALRRDTLNRMVPRELSGENRGPVGRG